MLTPSYAIKVQKLKAEVKTLMGMVDFPMSVSKADAIEIGRFVKKKLNSDEIIVRQISPKSFGLALKTKCPGELDAFWKQLKAKVTKKFGKKTIAPWNMADEITVIK